ncbi:MAG: hypothetical protein ACD_57C00277G0001 [uncultured bacterium]|nr:MAG: hypothetical protein ACD_57C00277G0001 [uncultured bacterium]
METNQPEANQSLSGSELQPLQTASNSKFFVPVVISILLSAMVTGSAVYFWQKSTNEKVINSLEQKIVSLQEQISTIEKDKGRVQPTLFPGSSLTPAIDPIANLKTYTSSLFSFKYPNNWIISPQKVLADYPEYQLYIIDDNDKFIGSIVVGKKGYKFKIDSSIPEDPSLEKYMKWNRYIRDDLPNQSCVEVTYGIFSGFQCSLNPYGKESFNFISKTNQRFVEVGGEEVLNQEFIKILSTFKFID